MSIRAFIRNLEKQSKIASAIQNICDSLLSSVCDGTLAGITLNGVSAEDAATLGRWCEANGLGWNYDSGEFTATCL